MKKVYEIEGLAKQPADSERHYREAKDGTALAVTRVRLDFTDLQRTKLGGAFDPALAHLMAIEHPYVRRVLAGGQDELDRLPWVASAWVDGERLRETSLSSEDIEGLQRQLEDLQGKLGKLAGCLSYEPESISTARTDDGQLHYLFQVDYERWFESFARGKVPGEGRTGDELGRALLRKIGVSEQVAKQVVQSRSGEPLEPIRSGLMVKALTALALILALGVIVAVTYVGEQKAEPARQAVQR